MFNNGIAYKNIASAGRCSAEGATIMLIKQIHGNHYQLKKYLSADYFADHFAPRIR